MGKRYAFTVTDDERKFVTKLIREVRSARGLTPLEAADSIEVHRNTFYRWERGQFPIAAIKVVCWLLQNKGDDEARSSAYWMERAYIAERRLIAINAHLVEYSKARRSIDSGDGAFEPSFVSPPQGSRARAA